MAANSSLEYTCHTYGDNVLQRVGVWQFKEQQSPGSSKDGYWLVFIHGGAWRDPSVDHETFIPSINSICASKTLLPSVRGFASIDYRLSPHPRHPQDPGSTPANQLRVARHPDHILDVRAALRLLADTYGVGTGSENKYILIGHSAGAMLAYQVPMGGDALGREPASGVLPLPAIVVGISGIYGLEGLSERHGGEYTRFVTSAFGEDKEEWRRVSPLAYGGRFASTYNYLAWSPEDSLIDEPEIDGMLNTLRSKGDLVTVDKSLAGEHDFVWEDGAQLPALISKAIDKYSQSSLS